MNFAFVLPVILVNKHGFVKFYAFDSGPGYTLNLSHDTGIKAGLIPACGKTVSETFRRPVTSGESNLKLIEKLA
ncbi:MAG TPA: hypothetical protein VGA82_04600 [Dehalococcoidales bacterium]